MSGEVVEDDNIARRQRRGKLGLYISLEDVPVHRPVHYERCGEPEASETGDEGLGFPVPDGALERSRSPLRQRPYRRVIFVVMPVSSMKTSLCGSSRILGCRRSSILGAFLMSGRSCSEASSFF